MRVGRAYDNWDSLYAIRQICVCLLFTDCQDESTETHDRRTTMGRIVLRSQSTKAMVRLVHKAATQEVLGETNYYKPRSILCVENRIYSRLPV